jgi:hypothetical protein
MTNRTAVPAADMMTRMWLWQGVALLLVALVTVGIVSIWLRWSPVPFNFVGFLLLSVAGPAVTDSLRAKRLRADNVVLNRLEKQFND